MGDKLYQCCSKCTAKWFSAEPVYRCPRCGSATLPAQNDVTPPWERKAEQCKAEE